MLSDVRVDRELEKYLGVSFQRYAILGVCNLALAFKALSKQEDSGLVILTISLSSKRHSTAVGLLKPTHYMAMIQNESIIDDAATIERKLYEVLDSLSRRKPRNEIPSLPRFSGLLPDPHSLRSEQLFISSSAGIPIPTGTHSCALL